MKPIKEIELTYHNIRESSLSEIRAFIGKLGISVRDTDVSEMEELHLYALSKEKHYCIAPGRGIVAYENLQNISDEFNVSSSIEVYHELSEKHAPKVTKVNALEIRQESEDGLTLILCHKFLDWES